MRMRAADDEGPVGDVVDFAEGPLFLEAVDDEGADAEGGGVFGLGVECGLRGRVGNLARGAEGDGVDFGALAAAGIVKARSVSEILRSRGTGAGRRVCMP